MSKDKNERKHRRTARHPEVKAIMAGANFEGTESLAAAMGRVRCIHGEKFPCAQCRANRHTNEAATGKKLSEREFEETYAAK